LRAARRCAAGTCRLPPPCCCSPAVSPSASSPAASAGVLSAAAPGASAPTLLLGCASSSPYLCAQHKATLPVVHKVYWCTKSTGTQSLLVHKVYLQLWVVNCDVSLRRRLASASALVPARHSSTYRSAHRWKDEARGSAAESMNSSSAELPLCRRPASPLPPAALPLAAPPPALPIGAASAAAASRISGSESEPLPAETSSSAPSSVSPAATRRCCQ